MEEQREACSAVRLGSPQWIPAVGCDGDENREAEEEHGDDLDFAFMPRDLVSGEEITADEIFSDGRIRPAFPLFGREVEPAGTDAEVVIPMQGLEIKDRDGIAESASSSECDELEGVPEKSYCVWAPERQVRSNSCGESPRLRIRDIIQGRSRSDGNKKFLFLTPPPPPPEKEIPKVGNEKKGKAVKVTELDIVTAHRLYYSKKGGEAVKGGRRSFLPYRPDLVGFFGNAANRAHKPF
ncbi:hypothetical protein J5N97_027976 [Dioscorea zingiberensis]|uniref:Uncharacterized protein n=1 Tax=Dioscorea zingiberensis TaxID=325984 RepID=A0A9D5H4G7_9LILI|nr:hypothetical protein J5N97_027976 [Dioscorea zingiberensis]